MLSCILSRIAYRLHTVAVARIVREMQPSMPRMPQCAGIHVRVVKVVVVEDV